MQERRKHIRREADRKLLQRMHDNEAAWGRRAGDSGHEARRQRRRVIRHNCSVEIQMEIGLATGNSDEWSVDAVAIKGRLLDLSHDGASLFTKQPLDMGQRLRLAIHTPNSKPLYTSGTIRWTKSVPDKGGYAAGVQFVQLEAKDRRRLDKYLTGLDRTIGL